VALETPCDFAKARYLDIHRFRLLWTYLILGLGVFVALFLAVSIILFLNSNWLPGALTALGTLLSGTVTGWLTTQRKTAVEEDEQAFNELAQCCSSPPAQKPLAAVTPAAPAAASQRPPVPNAADEIRQEKWFKDLETVASRSVLSTQPARQYLIELRAHEGNV
jgi:hypothetical protein